MQPVLEFFRRHERSYTYTVRAPQKHGETSVACYIDRGFVSLSACLFDAAQALSVNFPKVYIRYQGQCMGEIEACRLALCSESIAQTLMTEHLRSQGLLQADSEERAAPAVGRPDRIAAMG